jgi:hypothetical protein
MILWEYVRWVKEQALDTFNAWRRSLQKAECALLDEKINSLRTAGPDALPGFMVGPIKQKGKKYPHIYKLQIGGKKFRLRPLLCMGPIEPRSELTLLLGAREIQNNITPDPQIAVDRRALVEATPTRWRRPYRAEVIWTSRTSETN